MIPKAEPFLILAYCVFAKFQFGIFLILEVMNWNFIMGFATFKKFKNWQQASSSNLNLITLKLIPEFLKLVFAVQIFKLILHLRGLNSDDFPKLKTTDLYKIWCFSWINWKWQRSSQGYYKYWLFLILGLILPLTFLHVIFWSRAKKFKLT